MSRTVAAALVAVAIGSTVAAQAPAASRPDLKSLFPRRAEIRVDGPGLSQLLLPPEILAECQPDLSDLRVVDGRGREVPYIVDGGPPPETVLEERAVFTPELLAASQQTEERESAPDLRRETYLLSLPQGDAHRWDLVIESRRQQFVRQFAVMAVQAAPEARAEPGGAPGSQGVGSSAALIRAALESTDAPIAEGSLFRLQDPLREQLEAPLPILDADHLLVTLEGEGDFYLEPTFRLESRRLLPDRSQIRVDLAIRRLDSRDGRTVVELERPRGLVPDRLLVSSATGSFNRRFQVWDQGPGSTGEPLGVETLYRLAGAEDLESLAIPLGPARGDALRVVVDDGDSPPLEELAFQAALRRPSLVFSLDAVGAGERVGSLLFGGARTFRPRYDMAALLATQGLVRTGEQARIAAELLDPARLGVARLGPLTANPLWDPAPALAFAMRPGPDIAIWPFEYRRPVAVPSTEEGLLRLSLDPQTVARSRRDLADIRLVDIESRQWPYLLDHSGSKQRVALAVEGPQTEEATSIYALALPASPLVLEELLLDGPAPFFDRPFELHGIGEGRGERSRRLARGRLARRPEDPRELAISVGGGRLSALELRVEDGDDPPLEWTSVEARIEVPELYFAAPEGEYTLLFGNPDARRPRYELERVRDLVLAVDATAVMAGDLLEAGGRGAWSRFRGDGGWQQILLWSVLILAAVVLAGITLKLARQDPSPD